MSWRVRLNEHFPGGNTNIAIGGGVSVRSGDGSAVENPPDVYPDLAPAIGATRYTDFPFVEGTLTITRSSDGHEYVEGIDFQENAPNSWTNLAITPGTGIVIHYFIEPTLQTSEIQLQLEGLDLPGSDTWNLAEGFEAELNPDTGAIDITALGAGTGTGGRFTYTQATPSATWTIDHNLGVIPDINVYDSSGNLVEPDILNPTVNQTVIYFSTATSGVAYLDYGGGGGGGGGGGSTPVGAMQSVSLLNSWAYVSGGQVPGYYMDRERVWLRGRVGGGTSAVGTALFNLPVGYRPPLLVTLLAATDNAPIPLDIQTDGDVVIGDTAFAVGVEWLSLDGLSFRVVE